MKVLRLRKSSKSEAEEFRMKVDNLHPLEYVAECSDGFNIMIEGLHEGPGEPQYEVMAPFGFHFEPDEVHSLVCFSLDDCRERLSMNDLVPCTSQCG